MSAIWSSETNVTTIGGSAVILYTGEFVEAPAAWDSSSGQFRLQFQEEGNLVLLQMPDETVLWASGSEGLDGDTLIMQEDGNLVIYADGIFGTPIWSTETDGHEDSYLVLQNDGNLVIYDLTGLQNYAVFTVQPDWAQGITETLEWMTSVTESPQAVEQRMGLRVSPRQKFEISYVLFGPKRTYFDSLTMAGGGSPLYLPLWHDRGLLDTDISAGASALNIDTQYTEFQNCRFLVLMRNEFTYELAEIDAYTDSTITLKSPLLNSWEKRGTKVYPVKQVRVEQQPSGDRHADKASRFRMRFISMEPNKSNAVATLGTFLGNHVLQDEPNEENSLAYNYNRKMFLFDQQTGLQQISDVAPFLLQTHAWFAKGRERAWRLRGLLYALQGKRVPIWIPSFYADFELIANVDSAATVLDVKRCGYTDTGGPFKNREYILIHMRNGTRLYRKVTSAAIVGAEGLSERLTIDTSSGVDLTPDNVLRISFVSFSRLDQDTIELIHHSDSKGLTTSNLVWRTDPGIEGVMSETVIELPPFPPPPGPPVPPIYDPFLPPWGKLWQYVPSFATFSGSDYVGIWWAGRRTAEELGDDNPLLPIDMIDDAFPPSSISGSGAFVTLPMTGSFLMRIGLYWDPMGWTPPTEVTLAIRYFNAFIPDKEMIFGAGLPPGSPLNPNQRNMYATGRTEIAPNMTDPDTPIQIHLEYKFIGGVNAKPICNPTGDCEPYHGGAGFGEGGDSFWIIEWWP